MHCPCLACNPPLYEIIGCILVTDATAGVGLEPGIHHLGDMMVELTKDHKMTLVGTDTLAGSAASMDTCVRNFARFGKPPYRFQQSTHCLVYS